MSKIIPNPHDRYFRAAMSDPRVALDFFNAHLPPSILDIADLSSLKLEKETFLDEELKLSSSDLLYSVNLENKKSLFIFIGGASKSTR